MASNGGSDFDSKYTNANMARDATSYDPSLFRDLVKQLEEVDDGRIKEAAPGIIAAMLCAQHRGDSVPKLFRDLTGEKSAEETKALFVVFRQAITLIWPFVGLPQCIPASLGLVGELRQLGISITDQMDRPLLNEINWHEKGLETRKTIYRTAANSEVMDMMSGFFPELTYATHAVVFGFIIGGSEKTQSLPLSEITIAGAIAALGATRQTRTHFKGSMGLGISVATVQAVLSSAERVAAWNGNKLPGEVDVAALAEEVGTNLGSLDNA
ncbi:hypothetical protein CkaCkLH20_06867 [Colletotrichum karsti]|uniref:Carboxymuconolactone decarboxylase n=1 Tax=Colletotrichum karsti TaxID=1095194 RepID=A0A9P6I5K9_9PEZI|nr:uncharacterized protein CkaCkLH20_06867 [Colletotrichum karsti]KAF9875486.1 hypothetical protein CkaCkLH20_06867 [Colletotrichum karsti]